MTAFLELEAGIRGVVIPSYSALGELSCAYAQGSLVEGLAASADLDLVLVWESLPSSNRRPPAGLADAHPDPEVFDQAGFVLDRFWFRGQQIDAKHVTRSEFDGWWHAVEDGSGMSGYPMPVIAVHGLLTGAVLADATGLAAATQDRLRRVPSALQHSAAVAFRAGRPHYDHELGACVERDDGLLFHVLAAEGVRTALLAWFVTHGIYWPHEKRLGRRLVDLGRSDLGEAQSRIWSADNLASAFEAYRELCRLVDADIDESDV